MRSIHNEMRSSNRHDLSVPQFISLGFLSRHEGSSLSDLTRHLGLSLPTMSKMIDSLLARDLVQRKPDGRDRRRVVLAVTSRGQRLLNNARRSTQNYLASVLSGIPAEQQATVLQALQILGPLFGPAKTCLANPPG